MVSVSPVTPAYTPPSVKSAPVAVSETPPLAAPILDQVDISSFSRTDRNTDAGAVKDKKKSFKSMKDYIQYMLLMYAKVRDLKAKPGEFNVKMEDRDDLAKARDAIDDAELV